MRKFFEFDVTVKKEYNDDRYRSFLPEGDSIQPSGSIIDYEPFQFLQHATDLHAARSILKTGLEKNEITDNGIASSCATKEGAVRDRVLDSTVHNVAHPARALEVVWFGPRLNNGKPPEGYGPALGNIAFNLPAGFLMNLITSAAYNCYWIENFEFGTILAARFIITREHLTGLRRYDPSTAVSGPWRVMDGQHQVQTTFLSEDSKRLDLEFMLDLSKSDLESLHDIWTVTVRWPHQMNKAKQANLLFRDCDALVIFGLINALVDAGGEHRVAINIEVADDCLRKSDVAPDLLYLFEEDMNNSEERDNKLKETFLENNGIGAGLGWFMYQKYVKDYFQKMQREANEHGDRNGKRTMFLMIREHFHICSRQDILSCPNVGEKGFCVPIGNGFFED